MMRALILAAALLLPAANSCPAEPTPTPTQHCAEDDPCWNCHTMGNRTCSKGEHRT